MLQGGQHRARGRVAGRGREKDGRVRHGGPGPGPRAPHVLRP